MNILLLRNIEEACLSKKNILASLPFYHIDIAPLFKLISYDLTKFDLNTPIITTSKNAIKILSHANINKQQPLFVVGKTSAQYASSLGFVNIHIADGDARSLAQLIEKQTKYTKFIYLRGEIIRFDLKAHTDKIIYEHIGYGLKAVENPFQNLTKDYFKQSPILFIYSQNQAQTALQFLPKDNNIQVIAISQTALKPLIKTGYTDYHIALYPNEDAMISLVK